MDGSILVPTSSSHLLLLLFSFTTMTHHDKDDDHSTKDYRTSYHLSSLLDNHEPTQTEEPVQIVSKKADQTQIQLFPNRFVSGVGF